MEKQRKVNKGELIKALIRLALVCLAVITIAKPTSAPLNKQANVSDEPVKTVKQVEVQKPHVQAVAVKEVVTPPVPQQERPVEQPKPVVQALPTSKTELMRLAGIPESDYSHVDYIVQKESSWNYQAVNASSGATGLCQSWPASKMATEGSDYLTNPITQLKWCHKYATGRYGSWYSAFAFWQNNRWW